MNIWEGVALAMNQLRTQKLKSFFSFCDRIWCIARATPSQSCIPRLPPAP